MAQTKLERVSLEQLKDAKKRRLCGDMDNICMHTASILRNNHGNACAWCGQAGACTNFRECERRTVKKASLHCNCESGPGNGLLCFYHHHDDECFGIDKNDTSQLLNQPKWKWKAPKKNDVKENRSYVKDLAEKL